MEALKLTRKNMADLLLSLNESAAINPLTIFQEAWTPAKKVWDFKDLKTLLANELPSAFKKFHKANKDEVGFSINEIVSMSNLIEFTNLSSTTVQNWVKRDIKVLIGSPQLGRKYTVDQAAILYIVEDLKAVLDFESIRKVLTLIFNNPEDRTDDIINPVVFYSAYASVFDKLHHRTEAAYKEWGTINSNIEDIIKDECKALLPELEGLNNENEDMVLKVMIVAAVAVQTTCYQSLAREYMEAALF